MAARNLALLLVALHTGAIGQSALRYEKVRLDLSLNADGSVDVIEQRVLDPGSDCSPRFAISGRGAGTVILHGIYAWNQDSWQELSPLRVSRSGTTLRAELRARPPGLGRSYLLEYTLTEAVRRYDRTAELNWRLMEQGLGAVQLLIIEACLPQADARITSARLFLARCAEHNIRTEPGRVLLVAGPVSFAEPIDLQLAAPAELFATSPVRTGLPQSLRPYRPVFSSSGAPRIAGIILVALGILLLVAPLVYVISLNLRFRVEPDVGYYARYERSPPRPAAPAVVPAILNPTVRSPDFPRLMFGGLVATLLDLVRQRIVTLTRAAGALTEFRLTDPARVETLDPIPRSIARLFFSNISGGEPSLTVSQVANFLRYHSSFLRAYLGHYGAAATDWWRQELDVPWLVRPAVPKLGKFIVLTLGTSILGLVLVLFGRQLQSLPLTSLEELMRQIALISLSTLTHPLILLVPAVIFGAIGQSFILLVRHLRRWNPFALLECKRWRAYRQFLADFSALEQAPVELLPIWEECYVYATALGVAHKFLGQVVGLARQVEMKLSGLLEPEWATEITEGWVEIVEALRHERPTQAAPPLHSLQGNSPGDEV